MPDDQLARFREIIIGDGERRLDHWDIAERLRDAGCVIPKPPTREEAKAASRHTIAGSHAADLLLRQRPCLSIEEQSAVEALAKAFGFFSEAYAARQLSSHIITTWDTK